MNINIQERCRQGTKCLTALFIIINGIMSRILIILVITCFIISAWCGAEDSLTFISRTRLTGFVRDVSVNPGTIKYVPNGSKICIVDISNPYSPIHIKDHDPLTSAKAVFIVDTIMYCRGGSAFVTLNISDPLNPVNLSWQLLSGSTETPRGLFVENQMCYIARSNGGFNIYNIINPSAPESIGTYNTPVSAEDIYVCDTIAFVADYDSLQIVNVSNPSSCYRISAVGMHWGCTGVTVQGDYAYCAARGDWGTDGRVVVVDISDPNNPVALDSVYTIMGNPLNVFFTNNRIYTAATDYYTKQKRNEPPLIRNKEKADIEGGLRVINVEKPDSVYYTCGYNTFSEGGPWGVVADSQYVYIADLDSGLVILRHNHCLGVQGKPQVKPPSKARLEVFPNPSSGDMTIEYSLPEPGMVTINIYNMAGQLVRALVDGHKKDGKHSCIWNGKADNGQNVSSGNYLCRYKLNGKRTTQKAIVVN